MPCDPPCDAGHTCDGRGGCAPRAPIGEPCGAGCALGAYCSATQVCTRDPAAGEPCVPIDFLIVHVDYCGAGLACDVDGTCRAPHEVALGERCGMAAHCAADAYCEPSTGRCARTPGEGEPCIAHGSSSVAADEASCGAGLYCAVASPDDATGICAPRLAAGASCDRTHACRAPLRCALLDPTRRPDRPRRAWPRSGPVAGAATASSDPTTSRASTAAACSRRSWTPRAPQSGSAARAGAARTGAATSRSSACLASSPTTSAPRATARCAARRPKLGPACPGFPRTRPACGTRSARRARAVARFPRSVVAASRRPTTRRARSVARRPDAARRGRRRPRSRASRRSRSPASGARLRRSGSARRAAASRAA